MVHTYSVTSQVTLDDAMSPICRVLSASFRRRPYICSCKLCLAKLEPRAPADRLHYVHTVCTMSTPTTLKLTALVQGLFAPSITAEHPVSANSVAAASVCDKGGTHNRKS